MIKSSLKEPIQIEMELYHSGKLCDNVFEFKNKIRVKEKLDYLR